MATKKKAAPKTVKKPKTAPKAKPRKAPTKKTTKALLNQPPLSVRCYGEQENLLKKVSDRYGVPMGNIMRNITFKYLAVEYPLKAA